MDTATRAAYDAADDRARAYGVQMDGPSTAENAAARDRIAKDGNVEVDWTHPQLAKVTLLRLIGACREYPWWDVSYCYGELKNGTAVRVRLNIGGYGELGRFSWKRDLVAIAKRRGVYAKGLGMLDEGNISMLHG